MLSLKSLKLIFISSMIMLFAGTGCALLEKPGPTKAEIAAQKALEQNRADEAAAAKVEAVKKAADEEDTVQLQKIETVEVLSAEKLPENEPNEPPATESVSAPTLKIPTEPNTYLVTVEPKNKSHPFFGQGDKRGFVINGQQGQHIVARRGTAVTFKVRTGVQHDFYLTTIPKGWGAAPFVNGVEGQFTYNGDVIFAPTKETPADLYYGCRNHNSMGGHIVVVDSNADVAAIEKKLNAKRDAAAKNAKTGVKEEIKPQKVSQKISYVAMMLQFKGKGLSTDQVAAIKAKLTEAKQLQKSGDLVAALAVAKEAAVIFAGAGKKTGPTPEEIADQKEQLKDHMITLEAFVDSHKASYEQAEKQGGKLVDYDHDRVEKLVVEAGKLAKKQQFEAAKKQIKKAETLVIKALNQMLNATTIVYDLNFETPADEYAYEVKKFEGYLELIPVAIEVKKPKPATVKFMKTYVEKGKFYKGKADQAAKAERWKEAMVIIRDATIEVRRGLRILGVSM